MCDDDLVFKTQRPPQLRPRTSLEKEAFILRHVAAEAAIPVPRVLGYGREDDVEYLLMTRIPGVPLETTSLYRSRPRHRPRRTRRDPAAGPRHQPGRLGEVRADPRRRVRHAGSEAGWQPCSATWSPPSKSMSAGRPGLDLRAVADQFLAHLPAGTPRHPALQPRTRALLRRPRHRPVTGLIDFGDAYRSHPALDVRSWRPPTTAGTCSPVTRRSDPSRPALSTYGAPESSSPSCGSPPAGTVARNRQRTRSGNC